MNISCNPTRSATTISMVAHPVLYITFLPSTGSTEHRKHRAPKHRAPKHRSTLACTSATPLARWPHVTVCARRSTRGWRLMRTSAFKTGIMHYKLLLSSGGLDDLGVDHFKLQLKESGEPQILRGHLLRHLQRNDYVPACRRRIEHGGSRALGKRCALRADVPAGLTCRSHNSNLYPVTQQLRSGSRCSC